MNYNYLNLLLLNYCSNFTLKRFCEAKFFLKQTVQNRDFWISFCGVVLPIQPFQHIAFWKALLLVNCCGHAWFSSHCVCSTLVYRRGSCFCTLQELPLMKMAATTNCHIGIISRQITLCWEHCKPFHQYTLEVREGYY